ncbi:unnamed protein product [Peniophora sp. CBMAI 1063]|nr:unnamed protein product [Peniophora sp. CBMAI 1063]
MEQVAAVATYETTLPMDVQGEIIALLARQSPISIIDKKQNQRSFMDAGWLKISHVNRMWRESAMSRRDLWGENICKYPRAEIIQEFIRRASRAPLHINIDDLLAGCYIIQDTAAIEWLLSNRAILKRAHVIVSSLLSAEPRSSAINCLRGGMGDEVWADIFTHANFPRLTTLIYHMTGTSSLPTLINSRLTSLEIVPCQTTTGRERTPIGSRMIFRHERSWGAAPAFEMNDLLDWLESYSRLETLTFNAVTITDSSHQDPTTRVHLPRLRQMNIRGPHFDNIFKFASRIDPPPFHILNISSTLGTLFSPTPEMIERAGLSDVSGLDIIVETCDLFRWVTICHHTTRDAIKPAFCDGQSSPCLTGERKSRSSFYWRAAALSAQQAVLGADPHDALLGLDARNIRHLVVRELGRTHNGHRTWLRKAGNVRLVQNLHSLESITIEDERIARTVLDAVDSRDIREIRFTCRADWDGKSGLGGFVEAVGRVIAQATGRVTVVVSGPVRYVDSDCMKTLKRSQGYDVEDRRTIVQGIDSEEMTEKIERELQKARRQLKEAKMNVRALEAEEFRYPELYY